MKKLSHKKLQETGKQLNGLYLNCNCYTFENAVYYLTRLQEVESGSHLVGDVSNDEKINNFMKELKVELPKAHACRTEQLFYSVGTYGNIGQLYKFDVVDADYNEVGYCFYVYF